MSMLIALDNGYQACMMAPTEILAAQHYETIRKFLFGMDVRVELLMGSVKGKKREKILRDLLTGDVQILIARMPFGRYCGLFFFGNGGYRRATSFRGGSACQVME